MKLRTVALLLGLFTYLPVNGQLILTKDENLAWIEKVREEKQLAVRLEIIRTRILADTNVYVQNTGDLVILKSGKSAGKPDGLCRPLLIVEGYLIEINNDTDRQTVENLTKELIIENIKQLEVVEGEKALSHFGQRGWCGVILITTTNKKAKKTLLQYKA